MDGMEVSATECGREDGNAGCWDAPTKVSATCTHTWSIATNIGAADGPTWI